MKFLRALLSSRGSIFMMTLNWKFTRNLPTDAEESQGSNTTIIHKHAKKRLRNILNSGNGRFSMSLDYQVPSFIHLDSSRSSKIVNHHSKAHDNLLKSRLNYRGVGSEKYWFFRHLGKEGNNIVFYVQSDQVAGDMFGGSLRNLSIIGFYVTIVLAIGKLLREIFNEMIYKVMQQEMPHCDELIELIDCIYTARREGDTYKEQKLYEILIRVFRSPEMLCQLTGSYLQYDPNTDKENLKLKEKVE